MGPQEVHPPIKIAVVAAVIESGGRFLVCRRPAHKRHGGLFEFPGGKIHDGESLAQAVARELDEELAVGAVAIDGELACFEDPGSLFSIHFVGVRIDRDPSLVEHTELAWREASALLELPLAPSDRRFVQDILLREKR